MLIIEPDIDKSTESKSDAECSSRGINLTHKNETKNFSVILDLNRKIG